MGVAEPCGCILGAFADGRDGATGILLESLNKLADAGVNVARNRLVAFSKPCGRILRAFADRGGGATCIVLENLNKVGDAGIDILATVWWLSGALWSRPRCARRSQRRRSGRFFKGLREKGDARVEIARHRLVGLGDPRHGGVRAFAQSG